MGMPSVDLSDYRALYRAYVRMLESARERIMARGGTCDSVAVMERGDPALITARNVIEVAEREG